ncbi:MAG: hypothetical protein ACRDRA_07035 [Pseudonocardiaceae bacterium]
MNHRTAGKLMSAATLSLLVFTTTSGVAGLQVLAASPAMAEPVDQVKAPSEEAPAPAKPENPVTKLVGDVLGGGGGLI